MPYRSGSYALTPPSWPVFAISIVLAISTLLVRYAGVSIPILNTARVFDLLAIAYVILLIGVLVRRL